MTLLLTGIIIFFTIHMFPSWRTARQDIVAAIGEGRYKLLFCLGASIGLGLMIWGKVVAPYTFIWNTPEWGYRIAPFLMFCSIYCFVCVGMPSNLKRMTRHPMLWGIILWAGSHLLTNGNLSSIALFGSFGLFALVMLWTSNFRKAVKSNEKVSLGNEIKVLFITTGLFILLIYIHPYLFGKLAIGWGVLNSSL